MLCAASGKPRHYDSLAAAFNIEVDQADLTIVVSLLRKPAVVPGRETMPRLRAGWDIS